METLETKIQLLNEICTQLISANNSLLESLRIESALREDLEKRVEKLEAQLEMLIQKQVELEAMCHKMTHYNAIYTQIQLDVFENKLRSILEEARKCTS